jgi:hypothetical protein
MPGFAAGGGGCQNGSFAGSFSVGQEARVLLAMQKIEGSNPFSRSRKGVRLQVFFVGLRSCAIRESSRRAGVKQASTVATSERPRPRTTRTSPSSNGSCDGPRGVRLTAAGNRPDNLIFSARTPTAETSAAGMDAGCRGRSRSTSPRQRFLAAEVARAHAGESGEDFVEEAFHARMSYGSWRPW